MSERAPHHEHKEKETLPHHQVERHEHKPHTHEAPKTNEAEPNLQELKEKARLNALKGADISPAEQHKDTSPEPIIGMQREVKAKAYTHTLSKVRRHLSPSEKTLSKIVHQPVVESLSEVGAKTAARPSGLLAGGVFALLGSIALLYMSKHYGFRYNFFAFILLFVSGFLVGLIAEILTRILSGKKAS